jgi:hypothetical protein
MKTIRLLGALAVFGLPAFTATAQVPVIYNPLNIALVGQVQQEAVQGAPKDGVTFLQIEGTTNLTINTRSLLELIATDQGFTLPPKAKLWLAGDMFYILKQDNTIFKYIDSELLSITYVTNVLQYKMVQTTNKFVRSFTGTSVAILAYNGSSLSFTLTCYGKTTFYNAGNFKNPDNWIQSYSYSGSGFGSGTCDGQNMVIKGSLNGKYTLRYGGGGQGTGTFPGGGPSLPPLPPAPGGDGGVFPGQSGIFPGGGSSLPLLPPAPGDDAGTFPH